MGRAEKNRENPYGGVMCDGVCDGCDGPCFIVDRLVGYAEFWEKTWLAGKCPVSYSVARDGALRIEGEIRAYCTLDKLSLTDVAFIRRRSAEELEKVRLREQAASKQEES